MGPFTVGRTESPSVKQASDDVDSPEDFASDPSMILSAFRICRIFVSNTDRIPESRSNDEEAIVAFSEVFLLEFADERIMISMRAGARKEDAKILRESFSA